MAESNKNGSRGRRGPDGVTLAAGLLALTIATWLLAGFETPALQWVLAAGAVCVGAVLLAASLSPDSKRKSSPRS